MKLSSRTYDGVKQFDIKTNNLINKIREDHTITNTIKTELSFDLVSLFDAITFNNIQATKHFIKKGVDTNLRNNNEETLLFKAMLNQNIEICRLLLENKANPEILCLDKCSEFYEITPIYLACKLNSYDLVNLLLQFTTNLNIPSNVTKETILHYSIKHSINTDIILLLIQKGASQFILEKDNNGKIPTDYLSSTQFELKEKILKKSEKLETAIQSCTTKGISDVPSFIEKLNDKDKGYKQFNLKLKNEFESNDGCLDNNSKYKSLIQLLLASYL